jgi:hypothetical protein
MYARLDVVPQMVALMCDAASNTGSWDILGATIVPFCIRSTASAMGFSTGDDSMLYHNIVEEDFAGDNVPHFLLLSKVTSVLASLLGDMLNRRRTHLNLGLLTSQGGAADLDVLVQNLTWDLSTLAVKMFAHGQEYRSCATRILLQPILISLSDVSCITVMFGTIQHKLSRLLLSMYHNQTTMCHHMLIQTIPTQFIYAPQVWFPRSNMELLHFSIFIGTWRMNGCIYYTLFVLLNTEIGTSEHSLGS